MTRTKTLIRSKSFWGAVVSAGSFALGLMGIDVAMSEPDQVVLVDTILEVIGMGGAILAIVGRSVATTRISGLF